jgi:murein DD-endopeptidase MepM/ murein hydrolase activator NlpD
MTALRVGAVAFTLAVSVHVLTAGERATRRMEPVTRALSNPISPTPAPASGPVLDDLRVNEIRPPQSYRVHSIQPGDNLASVANRYNTTIESLILLNPGVENRTLPVGGTLLVIPNFQGVPYTVQVGDTLEGIAATYEIPVSAVTRIRTDEFLQIGEVLFLKGALPLEERPHAEVASRSEEGVNRRPTPAHPVEPPTAPQHKPSPPPPTRAPAGLMWPAQAILEFSEFGPRDDGFHQGLDMAAPLGTPVMAARSGRVIAAGWDNGYGLCIRIDHGDGMVTRYAHASKLYVSVGDWVEQGAVIMAMGATGRATGPHLHFEVIMDGNAVNPRLYLP